MSIWETATVTKPGKWVCFKCHAENSTVRRTCRHCGHESVLGRGGEGRAYTPPSEETTDYDYGTEWVD